MSPASAARLREATVLAVVAAIGFAVCAPSGPGWGDAADLARRAVTTPLEPFGRSYPLQSALIRGVAALVGDPARASYLVAAMIGGCGVGLVHWIGRCLLGTGPVASLGAAGAWAVHHTYWKSAVEGEVYALLGVLILACLAAALASRRSVSGAWVCGVLVGVLPLHHRAALFLAPLVLAAPVLLAPQEARRSALARGLLGLICGLAPFALLVAAAAQRAPGGADAAFLSSVLVGSPRNADLLLDSQRALLPSLLYVARWTLFCFPGPLLLLAPWGLVRMWREDARLGAVLLAAGTLGVVLPLRFDGVGDRHVFLEAAYPALVLAGACGLEAAAQRFGRSATTTLAVLSTLMPPTAYAALASTAAGRSLLPGLSAEAARETLLPVRTGPSGAAAWMRDVRPLLDGQATVYAEWGAGATLDYARDCGGALPGLRVVRRLPTASEVAAAGRTGVLVALTPLWSDERQRLAGVSGRTIPLGHSVYRVVPPE